jgi:uncharacterized protein (DUF2345 family)
LVACKTHLTCRYHFAQAGLQETTNLEGTRMVSRISKAACQDSTLKCKNVKSKKEQLRSQNWDKKKGSNARKDQSVSILFTLIVY